MQDLIAQEQFKMEVLDRGEIRDAYDMEFMVKRAYYREQNFRILKTAIQDRLEASTMSFPPGAPAVPAQGPEKV